jgi:hypothetical protein
MRGLSSTIAIAGTLTFLTGCTGGAPEPAPTYPLPARTVRTGETPVHAAPRTDGRVTFAVIGLRTRITYVVGSHGDQKSQLGQFVRVRLAVTNGYPTFHGLDLRKERLLSTDGRAYGIDGNATRIKRQPDALDLGSGDRTEFDLWFDVPAAVRVRALRLYGEPTDDLGVALPTGPGVTVPLT